MSVSQKPVPRLCTVFLRKPATEHMFYFNNSRKALPFIGIFWRERLISTCSVCKGFLCPQNKLAAYCRLIGFGFLLSPVPCM